MLKELGLVSLAWWLEWNSVKGMMDGTDQDVKSRY